MTDPPGSRPLRLTVDLEIVPLIEQTPAEVVVLQAASGASDRAVVRLARRDHQPLAPLTVQVQDPRLSAEIRQEGAAAVLELKLAPQPGPLEATTEVQVVTGIERAPIWTVPVRIVVVAADGGERP